MKRISSLLLVAVVACGGAQPAPATVPLSSEPKAEPEAEKPAPPPVPKQPEPVTVDLQIPPTLGTVKLVKAGTGKKAVLKIAAAAGSKQSVELDLDFSGKQIVPPGIPPEIASSSEDTAPTLVLTGDLTAGDVGSDGNAAFSITVNAVDAKDREGSKTTAAQFKAEQLGNIVGMTLSGSVAANGLAGPVTLHLDKADPKSAKMVQLLQSLMMPMWPQVPAEPIGVGAKWTVTSPYLIAGRINTTQTFDLELVSHKGNVWAVKGSAKRTGADQKVDDNALEKISGSGTFTMTYTDGALAPAMASTTVNDFTVDAAVPPGAGSGAPKTLQVQFHLEQGFGVSPK